MKKLLLLLLVAMVLLSGCVDQRAVKNGDIISIDYTGRLENGKVFDTSIESIAKEYNIPKTVYKPLEFKVGDPGIIKGLNEGVIGMKVGQTKTLTIPSEKAYGPINPELINAYKIIENMSATTTFPKVIEMPLDMFEARYGPGHNKSDTIPYPGTNINLTIQSIGSNVSLIYDLKPGYQISLENAPWNMTVVKIDDKNITVKPNVKKNDTVQFQLDQFQKTPWTSTVIGITNDNITLRHNAIPPTEIQTMYGRMKVSFNETSIMIDQNNELAGKTLIFNVTIVSINSTSIKGK